MQTNFTLAQLADSDTAAANQILRSCVHCGFCNATCPTYLELGDELDGPRGRIYLIKDMLEQAKPATALTKIGKKVMIAAIATFEVMPKPNQMTKNGASATLGMACRAMM